MNTQAMMGTASDMEPPDWVRHLNPVRRRVVDELLSHGHLFRDVLMAVQEERYPHAANLLLTTPWARLHPRHARTMARALETGERQE